MPEAQPKDRASTKAEPALVARGGMSWRRRGTAPGGITPPTGERTRRISGRRRICFSCEAALRFRMRNANPPIGRLDRCFRRRRRSLGRCLHAGLLSRAWQGWHGHLRSAGNTGAEASAIDARRGETRARPGLDAMHESAIGGLGRRSRFRA